MEVNFFFNLHEIFLKVFVGWLFFGFDLCHVCAHTHNMPDQKL